jgi:hypothetical protein
MDEVLELATVDAGIQDFFNLELLVVVDDNGRRRILSTTGDIIWANGLEERHMENWMDAHRGGKLETESCLAFLVCDWERTETLVVELVARASCLDIAS